MEISLPWSKPTSFDEIEKNGILVGTDDKGAIFVGRCTDRDGKWVPAKIVPALKAGFYTYNNAEESTDEVEYLNSAEDFHWVKCDGRHVQDAAVVSGFHIGRALYNGNLIVGRVDPDTRQLIGTFGGETLKLPSYDVLIYKAKGVVYEAIQKASNITTKLREEKAYVRSTVINGGVHEEIKIEQESYINLLNRIRTLEMEKVSYQKDKESLEFEQRKVFDLSNLLKKLRIENARFLKEREHLEEKLSAEQRKFITVDLKNQEFVLNNSFLLKRITALEEAIRQEKLLSESVSDKWMSSQSYNKSLFAKISGFEETIKTQQERIFELESEIMISSSSSETLLRKVTTYEETIKNLKLQIDTILKKLEVSTNDNDFLVKKLAMLTQTMRTYQAQIECLLTKLHSSKTIIANAHAELSRANAQVSKYQAALSSCYVVNGDLMTKVSGMAAVAQHQTGVDCNLNLVNITSNFGLKGFGYRNTLSMLEVTGSDSSFHKETEQAQTYPTEEFSILPISEQLPEIPISTRPAFVSDTLPEISARTAFGSQTVPAVNGNGIETAM